MITPSQRIKFGKVDDAYDNLHKRHEVLREVLGNIIQNGDITARKLAARALGEDDAAASIETLMPKPTGLVRVERCRYSIFSYADGSRIEVKEKP